MGIYISGFLLSLIFGKLALENKDKNKSRYIIFMIMSALPIFLISAFRYGVGTDYFYRYAPDFNMLLFGYNVGNLEFGFKLLIYMCMLFSKSYISLFIATSFLIIFPMYFLIFSKSKNPMLSICLFFITGLFFTSLNMVRQFITIVFLLYSYKYLIDKKYFKWSFFVFISFLIHKSSLIAFSFLLFTKKKIFDEKVVVLLSLLFLIFGTVIRDILYWIISFTNYAIYLDSAYSGLDVRETVILINIVIYFIFIKIYNSSKIEEKKEANFFLNIQGFTVVINFIAIQFSLLFRMSYYLSVFQILSIPYFLSITNKKNRKIYLIIIIVMFLVNLVYTYVFNGVDEVLPYRSVIIKDYEGWFFN